MSIGNISLKKKKETKNFIEPTEYFSDVHHSLNGKFGIISILMKD